MDLLRTGFAAILTRETPEEERRNARLEAIYATLPRIACKGKCQSCCGPVAYSGGEAARIDKAAAPLGVNMHRQIEGADESGQILANTDATCPALTACGKCAVYAVRPMICRVWGLSLDTACPHGCVPDRWLSPSEVKTYLALVRDNILAGPGAMFVRRLLSEPGLKERLNDFLGHPFRNREGGQ